MIGQTSEIDLSLPAEMCGQVSATAGRSARQMARWAAAYPRLFSAAPFDGTLHATLAMAAAFSGPWLSAEQLGMANKMCLWAFGADWLIDTVATGPAQVDELVAGCLAVTRGAEPPSGDDLLRFLADIRDELAGSAAFSVLGPLWHDHLARMLSAMAVEARWKHAAAAPSPADYLANADNLGFCAVFFAHLLHLESARSTVGAAELPAVEAAAQAVQRVIRVINDLGTHGRDQAWGDLNLLLVGVSAEEAENHLAALVRQAGDLIARLPAARRDWAAYLDRQMRFCAGFYAHADFWGGR
ncbi:hypothetical protein J5X84_11925 [Streptosporangiaceae bacterium NEAU-GS5]|nr:hypothetical protein [Streptosporangiaceae bacterium NEAU-GS5]